MHKTALLALSLFSTNAFSATYTFDPLHSYVRWEASHFGFSNQTGKWQANGKLEFDGNQLQNSKAQAVIKLEDIVSGVPDLDKHLKGKLFFNVAEFPTATFESKKVDVANNQITKVYGTLSLHGITKDVVLEVKQHKMGKNPINEKETIGFSAATQIKRSDFGIKTMIPGVSDEVTLQIEVEASV